MLDWVEVLMMGWPILSTSIVWSHSVEDADVLYGPGHYLVRNALYHRKLKGDLVPMLVNSSTSYILLFAVVYGRVL